MDSFKQTAPRPANCKQFRGATPITQPVQRPPNPFTGVEPTAPLCSPLSVSEPDDGSTPGIVLPAPVAAYKLPDMIPAAQDNLCELPPTNKRKRVNAQHTMAYPEPRSPHVVGVDAPWAPNGLSPSASIAAHLRHAAQWHRDGIHNPLPSHSASLPTSPEPAILAPDDPTNPLFREISSFDLRLPFPIGPFPGEPFTLVDVTFDKPRNNRPLRPVGVFDPAEVVFYQHQRRRAFVQMLVKDKGMTRAEAVAVAERLEGKGRSWAQMEDEAETAEGVLRVYGKLDPLPAWGLEGFSEVQGQGKVGGKGKARARAAPRRQGRVQRAPEDKGEAAAASRGKGRGVASASESEGSTLSDSSSSEASRLTRSTRSTRARTRTVKAREMVEDEEAEQTGKRRRGK